MNKSTEDVQCSSTSNSTAGSDTNRSDLAANVNALNMIEQLPANSPSMADEGEVVELDENDSEDDDDEDDDASSELSAISELFDMCKVNSNLLPPNFKKTFNWVCISASWHPI